MPDLLKELQEAMAAGVLRLIERQQRQRSIQSGSPSRALGGGQDLITPVSANVQDHFTTGYDSGTGTTTVPFLTGFSTVGNDEIVTA